MRERFMSAFDRGEYWTYSKTATSAVLEDLIFQAMAENPFKGNDARRNFIGGVSSAVNKCAIRRNRQLNGDK